MNNTIAVQYIDDVLSGDENAFRFLVKGYQEMVFTIARSMVRNVPDTKEVVQNTFISCYKGLASFKQESKFSSWLYRITVNEGLKYIRKNKNRYNKEGSNIEDHEAASSYLISNNTGLETLQQNDKKKEIDRVLSLMKPKESLMLELFYLKEFSISEIQDITQFSTNNIKVLLHRARKKFSASYNQE